MGSIRSVSCSAVSDKKWTELDTNQHRTHAMRLLDGLEVTAREKRLKVARAILYVAQGTVRMSPGASGSDGAWLCMDGLGKLCPVFTGTFGECSSEAEVQFWMRYNVFLLLEVGTFNALVELLNMEIE